MGWLTKIRAVPQVSLRGVMSVWDTVFMPIQMIRVNRFVKNKPIDTANFDALCNEELKTLVNDEWTRAKELDDKQQKLTAALSVAVTIGGLVGSTLLQNLTMSLAKYAAGGLFVTSMVFLIVGVWIGFNGLRPKPRYGHGAEFLRILKAGGTAARTELIGAASYFERDNIIRANEAMAAIASIRNGVLIFALAVIVGMVASIGNSSNAKADLHVTDLTLPPTKSAPISTKESKPFPKLIAPDTNRTPDKVTQ